MTMPWGMREWTGRFDDPSYLSPFAQELHAGYMRFKHIDDGTMWDMLKPGREGVGLHVGHLISPECCCGFYGSCYQEATYKDQNNPWLFPSIVNWKSVMVNNYLPHDDYIKNFDIDYPVVALTHVYSAMSDFRWALNNVNYEGDTDRYSYEPNDDRIKFNDSLIIGLVPLWTVIPLYTEKNIKLMQSSVQKLAGYTNMHLFEECWCTIEHTPCLEGCPSASDYRAKCTCNAIPNAYEALEDLYNDPPDVTQYMDDTSKTIWDYAVNRFYDGWQVISESAHQGEQWASYWQQAQSPFLGLPGQNFRDLLGLTA